MRQISVPNTLKKKSRCRSTVDIKLRNFIEGRRLFHGYTEIHLYLFTWQSYGKLIVVQQYTRKIVRKQWQWSIKQAVHLLWYFLKRNMPNIFSSSVCFFYHSSTQTPIVAKNMLISMYTCIGTVVIWLCSWHHSLLNHVIHSAHSLCREACWMHKLSLAVILQISVSVETMLRMSLDLPRKGKTVMC